MVAVIHHYQGQVVQEAKHGYDGKDIPGEKIIYNNIYANLLFLQTTYGTSQGLFCIQ